MEQDDEETTQDRERVSVTDVGIHILGINVAQLWVKNAAIAEN